MPDSRGHLASFLSFAEQLADAARLETLPRFRASAAIHDKGDHKFDPVTEGDRSAERVQRALIRSRFPEHGILGEEFGAENENAHWRWVLDPIDGTRAFISGAVTWTTLIALEQDRECVLGVIDQPFTGERWTGLNGYSSYSRMGVRTPCRTSDVSALADARIATTDPRPSGYFSPEESAAFGRLADGARLARFSLDAYGYALLAMGEMDLIAESTMKRHDFAALIPVVEGAGGIITDWNGNRPGSDLRGRVVASASSRLHDAALSILSKV